jgi:hypothetical protein
VILFAVSQRASTGICIFGFAPAFAAGQLDGKAMKRAARHVGFSLVPDNSGRNRLPDHQFRDYSG